MSTSSHHDLTALRDIFPSWEFSARWVSAGSGPDARFLQARRGDVTLTSWSAGDLAAQVLAEAFRHHQETGCTPDTPCASHDPGSAR